MNDTHNYNIIGFCSRKSSGKTLCTTILQNHGYTPLNFSDSLKEIICYILNISNHYLEQHKNNDNIKFHIYNDQQLLEISKYIETQTYINQDFVFYEFKKHNPKTIRQYLQIIGTDLIRKYNPIWHISKLISKIDVNKKYCIGDVRFLNEKNAIEQLGGKCFFIIRPSKNKYDDISNHISEREINWTFFDNKSILINDSTIDNLIIHGKNPENEKYYTKTNIFLSVNYKNTYLAGYIFLKNSDFTKNPFILENYKLWKCTNHKYPDILEQLPKQKQLYYQKIWLNGIFDYITQNKY